MKPLFSPLGMRSLTRVLRSRSLLIFDFDGVLAPLIAERHKAKPRQATLSLLEQLRKRIPIAVVTGRGRQDLLHRLGVKVDFIVGNHGIEGLPSLEDKASAARSATRRWERQLAPVLKKSRISGLDLENKGFSLTVHYRYSKEPAKAKKLLLKAASALKPQPRLVLGKRVVNFCLPEAPNKGDAVIALLRQTKRKSALFIGDDRTDEDVFSLKNRRIFTVRVGHWKKSRAQWYVSHQTRIDQVLRYCLRILSAH